MYIGLATADPDWAAGIQLLLNPKLLWSKSLLQCRQVGAVYVSNVYDLNPAKALLNIQLLKCKTNPNVWPIQP